MIRHIMAGHPSIVVKIFNTQSHLKTFNIPFHLKTFNTAFMSADIHSHQLHIQYPSHRLVYIWYTRLRLAWEEILVVVAGFKENILGYHIV